MEEKNVEQINEEVLEEKDKTSEETEEVRSEDSPEKKSRKNKKDKIKELEEVIGKLEEQYKKKSDELNDRLLRTTAEYENYRRRTEKEKIEASGRGKMAAIEKILPVLDTLQLAANAECENENYKKGVLMTAEMFRKALADMGVEEIEALGKPFDPNLHAAIAQDEAGEGVESGTVTRVLVKGYRLDSKIIRYAQVAVAM
ncbi:MAG: nucleotide exchange factor GrpE [Oscillospiraceae bacterium]|nr:nucleotide exchange factor GrpE [Oscillospiraceae bacterium]